jgi:hypothetical protein
MLSALIRPIGNTDSGDGGGAMRRLLAEHLKGFDRVFDAEDMQILGAAFDSAWEAVQASGVRYPQDKANWCGRYSRSILLRPPRTASGTTADYATALY